MPQSPTSGPVTAPTTSPTPGATPGVAPTRARSADTLVPTTPVVEPAPRASRRPDAAPRGEPGTLDEHGWFVPDHRPMEPAEIRREMAAIDWWHTLDLGHGIVTPGRGGSPALVQRMHLPASLAGKTVLDIGAFDGVLSFEAERRGAKRVVALDHRLPRGFVLAHRARRSSVEFVQRDVLELDPADIGTFDVVFFAGVVYHLPNPLGALERVFDVTRELMICETEAALDWLPMPAAECVGSREAYRNTALNWFYPNVPCLTMWCESVGYREVTPVFAPKPAPRSLPAKVLRKLGFGRPKSSRIVVHAKR